jgi:exonuclease SbcD
MIRVVHLSDSHFNEAGRLDDVVAVHRALVKDAEDRGVDIFLHGGDVFERRSTPAERLAVANFLREASAVAPVCIARGNHDVDLDLSIFRLLEQDHQHPIRIIDQPTAAPGSAVEVWAATTDKKFGIVAAPWFDRAHMVASLPVEADREDVRLATIEAARGLFNLLAIEARRVRDEGHIPLFVGHLQVQGSEVSTGQTLIGTSVEMSPADILAVGAEYAALGHIHKSQRWFDGRVAYSGSPHRCNFGEHESKGYRLVTLEDDGTFVRNEFIELPARQMVLIDVDWRQGALPVCSLPDVQDALVRFRYRIRAQDLHAVDEAALGAVFEEAGAHEVKLEAIVEASVAERSPEVAAARSLAEKLDAYLDAKGLDVDRARLHARLSELEAV